MIVIVGNPDSPRVLAVLDALSSYCVRAMTAARLAAEPRRGLPYHLAGVDAVEQGAFLEAARGLHLRSVVHPTAHVSPSATVQPGAFIDAMAYVGPGAMIGSAARIGVGAIIQAGATVSDAADVFAGAIVCPGVGVGRGAIVYAGQVVTDDVTAPAA